MTILDRDSILGADDRKIETVTIPEWGGDVHIRTMSGAERDAFEASLFVGKGKGENREANMRNLRARLASLTIVDDKGDRIFSNSDVKELGAKSAAALDRIFTAAQRLNGLTDSDVTDLAGE